MFEVIEQLKAEWTDKYVVINSPAPELSRFAKTTGTVRAVNMNGRCLVEFDQFNNIGWYDIDPSHLRVVTEPLPKPEKTAVTKTAPAAKVSSTKTAPAKKQSTADVLAAARGGGSKPAAKTTEKLSVAEILAKARGSSPEPTAESTAEPTAESTPDQEELTENSIVAEEMTIETESLPDKGASVGSLPTTTAEKIAWCRQHDAQ
ncbi:MAG: hypothetical protein CMJ66_07425 [Planctomycetaceae bacterium]|jgi:hypothetical protein|nr:hypothetical protein [Planctomycetaceae bacterium]MBQ79858.1 hypothetical protein [Planctomycetaceae bacterium]